MKWECVKSGIWIGRLWVDGVADNLRVYMTRLESGKWSIYRAYDGVTMVFKEGTFWKARKGAEVWAMDVKMQLLPAYL